MDDQQALFDDDGLPRRIVYRLEHVRTPQNELQYWVTISALLPPVPTSSLLLPADEVAKEWSPWSPSAEDDQSTAAGGAAAGGAPAGGAPAAAPIAAGGAPAAAPIAASKSISPLPSGTGPVAEGEAVKQACPLCRKRKKRCVHMELPAEAASSGIGCSDTKTEAAEQTRRGALSTERREKRGDHPGQKVPIHVREKQNKRRRENALGEPAEAGPAGEEHMEEAPQYSETTEGAEKDYAALLHYERTRPLRSWEMEGPSKFVEMDPARRAKMEGSGAASSGKQPAPSVHNSEFAWMGGVSAGADAEVDAADVLMRLKLPVERLGYEDPKTQDQMSMDNDDRLDKVKRAWTARCERFATSNVYGDFANWYHAQHGGKNKVKEGGDLRGVRVMDDALGLDDNKGHHGLMTTRNVKTGQMLAILGDTKKLQDESYTGENYFAVSWQGKPVKVSYNVDNDDRLGAYVNGAWGILEGKANCIFHVVTCNFLDGPVGVVFVVASQDIPTGTQLVAPYEHSGVELPM